MLASGMALLGIGVVAFLIGGGMFAARAPLPPLLNWIGRLCFFGWPVPLLSGLASLVIGFARWTSVS